MSNSWKIYMLAIVCFLVGTSEYIIAGILDMIARDVGVSVAAAGQLITVYSIAYAFGTPIMMALTARVERRKLMMVALSVFAVGNLIAVLFPGFISLMGSRVVLAVSTGVFVVVALTVTSKLAQPGKQGSAIATVVMGFSTSLIGCPPWQGRCIRIRLENDFRWHRHTRIACDACHFPDYSKDRRRGSRAAAFAACAAQKSQNRPSPYRLPFSGSLDMLLFILIYRRFCLRLPE